MSVTDRQTNSMREGLHFTSLYCAAKNQLTCCKNDISNAEGPGFIQGTPCSFYCLLLVLVIVVLLVAEALCLRVFQPSVLCPSILYQLLPILCDTISPYIVDGF